MSDILACHLHDYLEVACLFKYEVRLALSDGSGVTGIAKTTETSRDKNEYLHLCVTGAQGNEEEILRVPTLTIRKMEVLTPQARFREVDFSSS